MTADELVHLIACRIRDLVPTRWSAYARMMVAGLPATLADGTEEAAAYDHVSGGLFNKETFAAFCRFRSTVMLMLLKHFGTGVRCCFRGKL
jgi:hypothetical protein